MWMNVFRCRPNSFLCIYPICMRPWQQSTWWKSEFPFSNGVHDFISDALSILPGSTYCSIVWLTEKPESVLWKHNSVYIFLRPDIWRLYARKHFRFLDCAKRSLQRSRGLHGSRAPGCLQQAHGAHPACAIKILWQNLRCNYIPHKFLKKWFLFGGVYSHRMYNLCVVVIVAAL